MPSDVVPPNLPPYRPDSDAAGNDPFGVGPGPAYDPFLDKPPASYGSLGGPLPPPVEKRRAAKFSDVTIIVLLPWLVFFLLLSLFLAAFHQMETMVWVLITVCGSLAAVFFCLGACARHALFVSIGFLCFTSVVMATGCGLWLQQNYLQRYWELEGGNELKDVNPLASAKSTHGAAVVHFIPGTFVDDRRTMGFVSQGGILCLAPVAVRAKPSDRVDFWAVGEDCCEMRSNFNCGAARDPAASTAVVERRGPLYARAIDQAAAVYHLNSTNDAQLVSFVNNPKAAIADIWDESLTIALIAMIVDLCMCVIAGLVVARVMSRAGAAAPLPLPKDL